MRTALQKATGFVLVVAFAAFVALAALFAFATLETPYSAAARWNPYSPAVAANQELRGRVVILDAGHGAETTNRYADYDEQATMLALARKIRPLLEARGATVHMTRPAESDVPLPVRTATINKWALEAVSDARHRELSERRAAGENTSAIQRDILEIDRLLKVARSVIDDHETNAPVYLNVPYDDTYAREIHPDWRKIFEYEDDPEIRERFLVISLHSNATPRPIDTSRRGADAFYISNDLERNASYYTNYSYEEQSAWFAELILDRIDAVGIEKQRARGFFYHILREHNVPCVLVENGFHTNDGDRAKLLDDAFLDRLARVYADAVAVYFAAAGSLPESGPEKYGDVFARTAT